MLSVGNRTLWNDGKQLSLGSILSFLWECYLLDTEAAYVGFFLGYDFIQWERLLPESLAFSLLATEGIAARTSQVHSRPNPFPDPVVVDCHSDGLWEIDIMAGRRWKLRPHAHLRSAYNGMCRNRTCRKVLEDVIIHDCPEILPGECEWRIPSDNGRDYVGSARDFWKTFILVSEDSRTDGVHARIPGWLFICDTGPFWQTGFVNVIDPKQWGDHPVCTPEEYALIVEGKADRGVVADYGDTHYYESMVRYNILENDILGRVTTRLNQGFMNESIPIKLGRNEWYGPGRAAQVWMDMLHQRIAEPTAIAWNKELGIRYRVNSAERRNELGLLNADIYMSMPSWFYDAARASYYGGWFEQMVHGHCGDVWEYDINSAYPFIIASLPCLHSEFPHTGEYREGTGNPVIPDDTTTLYLLFGEITGSNPYIGTMPYRDSHGRIFRPHRVKGWYWWHEISAATRAGLIDQIQIEKWVSYTPCICAPPFNPDSIGITRMYELRLSAGKNSPEGKALKLLYNSAYGKTAQSVGSPKYSNPVYASLITAGCRTLILDAIASHPDGASAVTMVATDGIYFTSRHPGLRLSKTELGAWDETYKENLTQLMPGVYWDDKTRESVTRGESPKLKSRGVNARDLARQIQSLDSSFALFHLAVSKNRHTDWPALVFNVNFLLHSAKLALRRGKWNTAGKVEHDTQRAISSNPITKRLPEPYFDTDTGLIRTRVYPAGNPIETTPYSKAFGYTNPDDYVDRDGGDGLDYWRDLIRT